MSSPLTGCYTEFVPGRAAHRALSTATSTPTCTTTVALCVHKKRSARPAKSPPAEALDNLTSATANVNTLYPRELKQSSTAQGCSSTSRMLILGTAFANAGVHVVFVQEGRLPGNGVAHCKNFVMYRAGVDDNGCFGVQLWISRRFAKHVVTTTVRSTRAMRVDLRFGKVLVHLISAHAPCEDAPAAEREAFWSAFAADLTTMTARPGAHIIMGIDANAHLGSVPSPALGHCEAQEENHNGASLRATAEEHDLSVVNSFYDAGPTWTSSYNLKSRIDYLCVSQAMLR